MAELKLESKKLAGLLLTGILSLGLGACGGKLEFSTDVLRINDALPKVQFLISQGSVTVFDVSGKKPEKLQELTFGEVSDLEFSKEMFTAEDLNFDGSADISLPSLLGASNGYSYVWLWDEMANGFVYHEELSALSLLVVDPEKKILTTVESGGAAEHREAAYDWVDGKLTLLWEVCTLTDIGSGDVTEQRTERQPDGSYALAD